MKSFYFFFIIILLILSSCSTQDTQVQQQSPKQKLEARLHQLFNSNNHPDTSIKRQGSGYNVMVTYTPYNKFRFVSEDTDRKTFESSVYNFVRNIYASGAKVNYVTLKAVEQSQKLVANPKGQLHLISQSNDSMTREIAIVNITKEEFDTLKNTYEDPQYKIGDYITYHPFFLVELRLRTEKTGIKNLIVGEVNDSGEDVTEIRYEPSNVKTLGQKDGDKLGFDENFANIIRYSFEAGPTIEKIRLIAQADYVDNRSTENTSTIAQYTETREDFEQIMDNWDSYRSRIIDHINYTPIFLLDMISESTIESLKLGPSTEVDAFYDKDYSKMTKTVDTIEQDAVDTIYALFDDYPYIQQVTLRYKAKLPAEEGSDSPDGTHQIIHDAYVVTVSRSAAQNVNRDKLSNKQVLYNFDQKWDQKMMIQDIRANIGSEYGSGVEDSNIISITMPSDDEAVVDLDSCEIKDDYDKKVGQESCGKKCVSDRLDKLGNRTMYQIHPPYLTKLTFKITSVYLDQSGHEDTTDMGEMVFTKDPDTNYWLQTASDVRWYDLENDLSLDKDKLCQT